MSPGCVGRLHVAFSPDKKTLALGPSDHSLVLWDAVTGKQLHHLWNRAAVYRLSRSVRFPCRSVCTDRVEIPIQSQGAGGGGNDSVPAGRGCEREANRRSSM